SDLGAREQAPAGVVGQVKRLEPQLELSHPFSAEDDARARLPTLRAIVAADRHNLGHLRDFRIAPTVRGWRFSRWRSRPPATASPAAPTCCRPGRRTGRT